ncbi:MAG: GNAT family N-acetyltransferase [Bacteroidetes bacterium]|nr:GNAT family N-acetyltransferase [Bacteroidota bacterium]
MTINKLDIKLRPTVIADLDQLYQFQFGKKANGLAVFTSNNTIDKTAYLSKYLKLLNDPTVNNQTILVDNIIVGSVAKFERKNEVEVTYLIDRNHWGKGIATNSLNYFLAIETIRPIFGRVAFDNFGSQKVLEKCGFVKIREEKYYANTRQAEIVEFVYRLGSKISETHSIQQTLSKLV